MLIQHTMRDGLVNLPGQDGDHPDSYARDL